MGTKTSLDAGAVTEFCARTWDDEIVPQLVDYIRIPAKSPLFDADWEKNGYLEDAVTLIERWCRQRGIEGLEVEVVRLPGRTPLIYMEIPPFGADGAPGDADPASDTVLLYGHLDKQPEMTGWRDDLGPWKPVIEGDRLYGRGGADDGYAAFASLTAIEAVQRHGGSHRRCVVLIEACEESGSGDLPHYVEHLSERIGEVSLVVCLDSFAGDYERLWNTTSLRGMIAGDLCVDVLEEGVHSGDASGVVPSTFRIARMLLERIEDAQTGRVRLPEFHVEVPPQRLEQARETAAVLGVEGCGSGKFPFVQGAGPAPDDPVDMLLARSWWPTLSVTGAGGLPALQDAGNVLRPHTALKLSLRLPPTADHDACLEALTETLESDPPYGARVSFRPDKGANGWHAPELAPWLDDAVKRASQTFFDQPSANMGEGGSIPFMGMLGAKFPDAQFLITGVLGPGSNAHGPNEFLHVPLGKGVTACVAAVLHEHALRDA